MLVFFLGGGVCLCFCGKIGFYFREKWNNQNALKLSFERLNCYACLRAFFVRMTEWSLTCWLCESYGVYTAKMWWSHNFVSSGNGLFHWKWRSIQLSMNIIQQTNKQIDNNLLYCLFSPKKLCQNVPNITMKPLACSWWFHLTLEFWTFCHLSIVHIN